MGWAPTKATQLLDIHSARPSTETPQVGFRISNEEEQTQKSTLRMTWVLTAFRCPTTCGRGASQKSAQLPSKLGQGVQVVLFQALQNVMDPH